MGSKFRTLLFAFMAGIGLPILAQAEYSKYELQLNGYPTTLYNINEYANKIFVRFYDVQGIYSKTSFFEFDLITKTLKYTNNAYDDTADTDFTVCTTSYSELPLENATRDKVFGVDFNFECGAGRFFRGTFYFEGAQHANGFVAPICDTATSTITAMELERTELEKQITSLDLKVKSLEAANGTQLGMVNHLQGENLALTNTIKKLRKKIRELKAKLR